MTHAFRIMVGILFLTGANMNHAQTAGETRPLHEGVDRAAIAEADLRVHTREDFDFVANATMEKVFPLFGAHMERVWAGGWDPRFIWPPKAEDREGMVFGIAHGDRTATWVNTLFDRGAGRVQYVYVLPDLVATLISLSLTPQRDSTHVIVRYERTSLSAEADALVRGMAEHDRMAGPEWAAQINSYLSHSGHEPRP